MSISSGIRVHGGDSHTRCAHYNLPIDIVAIRHACCDSYFACHLCHAELADHAAAPWPADRFDEPAVLCGSCGHEMTVNAYLETDDCPRCRARFNPGCKTHTELYFEVPAPHLP